MKRGEECRRMMSGFGAVRVVLRWLLVAYTPLAIVGSPLSNDEPIRILEDTLRDDGAGIRKEDQLRLRDLLKEVLYQGRGAEHLRAADQLRLQVINSKVQEAVRHFPRESLDSPLQRDAATARFRAALASALVAPVYPGEWTQALDDQVNAICGSLTQVGVSLYPEIEGTPISALIKEELLRTARRFAASAATPMLKYAMPEKEFEETLAETLANAEHLQRSTVITNGWQGMSEGDRRKEFTENTQALVQRIAGQLDPMCLDIFRKNGSAAVRDVFPPVDETAVIAEMEIVLYPLTTAEIDTLTANAAQEVPALQQKFLEEHSSAEKIVEMQSQQNEVEKTRGQILHDVAKGIESEISAFEPAPAPTVDVSNRASEAPSATEPVSHAVVSLPTSGRTTGILILAVAAGLVTLACAGYLLRRKDQ